MSGPTDGQRKAHEINVRIINAWLVKSGCNCRPVIDSLFDVGKDRLVGTRVYHRVPCAMWN